MENVPSVAKFRPSVPKFRPRRAAHRKSSRDLRLGTQSFTICLTGRIWFVLEVLPLFFAKGPEVNLVPVNCSRGGSLRKLDRPLALENLIPIEYDGLLEAARDYCQTNRSYFLSKRQVRVAISYDRNFKKRTPASY